MKSIWSLLCAPSFVLSAFCSPPGSSCPSKSRRVSGERDSALQLDESLGKLGAREPDAGQHNEAQCYQEQER